MDFLCMPVVFARDIDSAVEEARHFGRYARVSDESGEYIDSKKWTNGCYYDDNNNKIELGIKDQLVNRYVHKSSLLIFAKESPFKLIYNKTLNSLSEDEIAQIIEDLIVKEC